MGASPRFVGGRFAHVSDALRKRLRALLTFEEARPQLSLLAIDAPRGTAGRATAKSTPRRRRGVKR